MMERLSGLDAGFLYMETPTLHLHTLKIATVEHRDPQRPYSFQRFRDTLAERLYLLPPFRRRVVHVPLDLDHPVWIEDPDFDIDKHLHRVVLPADAGPREVAKVVSEIAGRQLDRSRPLWEITAVEGLAGGRTVFIAKLHHCLADGTAASELLANVLMVSPDGKDATSPPPWTPDPIPSRRRLATAAAGSFARRAANLPGLVRSTAKGLVAIAKHARASDVESAVPFRTPKVAFHAALTPNRIYATVRLPLDELKRVRKLHGATLNDVFLAVATGALRAYLSKRGELPKVALVAGVPASVGGEEPGRMSGNKVSNLFALLPVHLEDPRAQIAAISAAMKVAKERHVMIGPGVLEDWTEMSLQWPLGPFMRSWSRWKMSNRVGSPINLVASNVPGPRVPLFLGDTALVDLQSIGPILEGIGLNITAWSYVDILSVAFLACPEHMPDLWDLAEAFPEALRALGENGKS